MNEQKITVELTEGEVRAFLADHDNGGSVASAVVDALRAALPPEYAEGTVARVHYWSADEDDRRVQFVEWRDGEWKFANGMTSYELRNNVTKVEPLRVAGPDELVVKRGGYFTPPAQLRSLADFLERKYEAQASDIVRACADALEAEDARRG